MGLLNRFDIEGQKSAKLFFSFAETDVFKKVFEVVEWVEAIGCCGCNEAIEQRAGVGAFRASGEEPVFSSYGKRPNLVFYTVVVDFKSSIKQIVGELFPSLVHVVQGIAEFGLRNRMPQGLIKPLFHLFQNGLGFLQTQLKALLRAEIPITSRFFYGIKLLEIGDGLVRFTRGFSKFNQLGKGASCMSHTTKVDNLGAIIDPIITFVAIGL